MHPPKSSGSGSGRHQCVATMGASGVGRWVSAEAAALALSLRPVRFSMCASVASGLVRVGVRVRLIGFRVRFFGLGFVFLLGLACVGVRVS